MTADPSRVCQRAFVSGRVQGVFYRASTADQARRLGVDGYARNLADGRVEVVACGPADAVQALIDWLWQGSSASKVTDVQSAPLDGAPPTAGSGFRSL
jgi:acylphosphatase